MLIDFYRRVTYNIPMKKSTEAGVPQFLQYLVERDIPEAEFTTAYAEDSGVPLKWTRDVPIAKTTFKIRRETAKLRESNDYTARRIALMKQRNEQQRRKVENAKDVREILSENQPLIKEAQRTAALKQDENALNAEYRKITDRN